MTLDLVYKSNSETRAVRVVMLEGNPWFALADVCTILDLGSPHKVAARLEPEDKGRTSIPTLGGLQELSIVSEAGLYAVILGARSNPHTKPFKDWVTREVLPSIRKTGGYSVTPAALPDELPDDPISLALVASLETRKDLAKLEQRTASLEQRISEEPLRSSEIAQVYNLGQKLGGLVGHRKGWRMFKERFGLASYRDLPRCKLQEGMQFLELQIKAYTAQERLVTA